MNWNDIPHFLAVYRTGSLALAARELGVVATTVGRRITALETALGQTLFTRTPSGYRPTERAEHLFEHALAVEAQMLALSRSVVSSRKTLSGHVRLATLAVLATRVFAPNLARLHRVHPGISLTLSGETRIHDLMRSEADIAVRIVKPAQGSLVFRRLGDVSLGLYASPEHLRQQGLGASSREGQVWIERGASVQLVGFEPTFDGLQEMQWLTSCFPNAPYVLRANSTEILERAIIDGVGMGFLPRRFALERGPLLRELSVMGVEPLPERKIWMVIHEDLRDVPVIRAVMDWIVGCFEGSPLT